VRFVMGFSAVVLAASLAWPFVPRRYEATATIIMHPSEQDVPSENAQFMRQPLDENAIQSEIDNIASPRIADAVMADQHIAMDPEFNGTNSWFKQPPATAAELRQRFMDHFNVSRDRRSYTVKIGVTSSEASKSAMLTEAWLKAYQLDQTARKRQHIDEVTKWLEGKVALLRAKSEASERAVKSFLVDTGLIDTGAQIALEHQLSTLTNEAALARSRATDTLLRAAALSEMKEAGTLSSAPEVLASTFIQRLKENQVAAAAKPSVWAAETKAIEAQIAAESERIVAGVKVEARTSALRVDALLRDIQTIRETMTARRLAELRFDLLRRDADSDKSVLDDALVRFKGQTARAASVRPDFDIVATPEIPSRPLFPNRLLAIIGTLLFACLAGAAMIWRPLFLRARQMLAA
jgi:uncharacterized protein involved in exopolysaccharide biosynthesis